MCVLLLVVVPFRGLLKLFIPTLIAWSSGSGQRRLALPSINAMEYWSAGVLEYWVWWNYICFYMNGERLNIKTDHHPLLMPITPLLHSSIKFPKE